MNLERDNARVALKRVRRNKGSPGIDGMSVEELPRYLTEHWTELREQLLTGTYQPRPVKRQAIPKPDGGVRELGIPSVVDRFVQQAILQVLQPRIDPSFSEHSHGFRPGRSAHDAIRAAQRFMQEGRRWVVDVDLEKFFGAPGQSWRFQRVEFPPQKEGSHLTANRVLAPRRQRRGSSVDRGHAVRNASEAIEPRDMKIRRPTGSKTWKATVGGRNGEAAGDFGGV